MINDSLLLVFVKNPVLGKVKTRLASTIGDEQALMVYKILLNHTLQISQPINVDKIVFYSDEIIENDPWKKANFQQFLQVGNDLGEKMLNAFQTAFVLGYKKVIIIGSDCLELTSEILNQAFTSLNENKTVVGPAKDGGYYLLGLKKMYPQLFKNKKWSTNSVLSSTLLDFEDLEIKPFLLPTFSDIDEEKDLRNFPEILAKIK